ncbi:phosphopantetheine-binding protein [Nonomuraea sp. KM90]|uniref:phosphopantetheine-binding protein n=1 Tax=Nonomuraea sp. KM90 TaxID=3457428 RepID=UPI003FCEAB28
MVVQLRNAASLPTPGDHVVVVVPEAFLTGVGARRIAYARMAVPETVGFATVPELWTDATGGLDEARCREHVLADGGVNRYEPPRTPAERAIVALWQEILAFPGVGVLDDFIEAGGDSVSALRLIDAVREGFGVDLTLADLMDHPTVRDLAAEISTRGPA